MKRNHGKVKMFKSIIADVWQVIINNTFGIFFSLGIYFLCMVLTYDLYKDYIPINEFFFKVLSQNKDLHLTHCTHTSATAHEFSSRFTLLTPSPLTTIWTYSHIQYIIQDIKIQKTTTENRKIVNYFYLYK